MKKITTLILGLLVSLTSHSQLLTENFDDITTLPGDGWSQLNVSTTLGSTSWFQGNDAVFPAQNGAVTAYIGANFNNTTGTNTISNWLITPVLSVENNDVISFYTRTVTASTFPDRLQVRLSDTGGSSTDPINDFDLGSYTNLLLDINPALFTGVYPDSWALQTVNITGLTGLTDVRIAFRYFVTNAGPTGANSDYIGIDAVSITSTLGTNDFVSNEFNYFYNRDLNQLLLESSNVNLSSIEVYNLLGQNVYNKSLSDVRENVNLALLTDGVYIVRIKIGNNEKVFKILK